MLNQLAVVDAESTSRTKKRVTIFSTVASVLAILALVIFGAVGSANATTIVSNATMIGKLSIGKISPTPKYRYSGVTTVTVSGTGVPGDFVAVTECNSTLGGLTGTFCNHTASATAHAFQTVPVDTTGHWKATISVRPQFTNWNYQTNSPASPASTTNCLCHARRTQCQVQVQAAEYTTNPPTQAPVDTTGTNIRF